MTSIHFQDFVPKVSGTKKVLFMTVKDYEPVGETLDEMNAWIAKHQIDVVNVESVVLPNIHLEDGSTDGALATSGEMSSQWFQVVRVWYRRDVPEPPPLPLP